MKNFYKFTVRHITVVLLIMVLMSAGYTGLAQAPTVPSTNLSFSNLDGDRFIAYYNRGNGARIIIVASESPVTAVPVDGADYLAGNYGLGNEIGPGQFVVYSGTGSGTWLYGFNHSTTYYLRIYEYNGTDFNTKYLTSEFLEGNITTLTGPALQASNLTFSNITGNSMTLNWTKGDGTSRMVVARVDAPVDAEPVDLTSYGASSSFGGGNQISPGNYVIYNGTGTSMNLSNLAPNRTYHFSVFEYNGSSGRIYLRPGATGSQLTASAPTVTATNFSTRSIDGNRFIYEFTPGNGTRRMVIAKKGSPVTAVPADGETYAANDVFGSGTQIIPDEYVIYNGTGSASWLYGLEPGTTYHFAVFEYNGTGSETFYLTNPYLSGTGSTLTGPTLQASNLTFSNITGNSMTLNWAKGDGTSRMVVARVDAPVDAEPVDLTSYGASSSFGGGNQISPGNYVIYNGTGTSMNLSNLAPNRTYHFSVFEYNGSSGRIYLRPGATGSQLTASAPTVTATNFSTRSIDGNRFIYEFTPGNGTRRMVITKKGSPVTAVPADGETYAANDVFGSGTQIIPDEYVIYNGTGSASWLYGLEPGTTYHFAVFEYNGTGSETFYLTNPYLSGTGSTLTGPTLQASNLTFSNITGNSMTLNWAKGDGTSRMVVARVDAPVDAEPVDLTSYGASSSFGGGNQISPGNYVIYNGTGTSMNLSNLAPNRTYHFSVFEYNGSSGRIYLRPGATGSQLTASVPTVTATNFSTRSIDGNRFIYEFTPGNGTRRMVIAKKGSAVTAVPADGETYAANDVFGSGTQIIPDEYVIYNGTGSASWLYGLEPGTTYHFAVFEYNGTGSEIFYLTNPYLSGTGSTLSNPTVQSGNAFISSRSNSSINISWTKGDGANRLLIGRKDGPVNVEPQDLTNYSVSSTFGTREIGTGNFLLYGGTGTNINITNLEAGTNYHFALFEYNGSNAKLYLRPGYQFALETFGERPTLQVSNATYSNVDFTSFNVAFTPGNGSRRLVLARAGSPVNAGPSDFFSYAANHMFGHGDQIGNGNYVVYNDFGDNFQLSGLTPGVTYYFAYFEYSMSQQGELYLSPAYTSTQATKQPFDLNLTAITSPASACELTAGESITIEVTNESTTPVTSFIAGYSINGSTPVNEVVSGENLLPGNGSVTYTFQTLADLSVDGDYTIEAFIILEGDVNENNNVRTATVRNFPEPVTTITDDSSISQGQAITLVATGGVSYEWSNGETTSDITVQPLVTTQYTVTITDANGCSVVRVVTVEVIPDPCYGVNCPPGTICYDGSCFAYTVQVGGVVTDADISIPLEGVKVSNGASEVYSDINGAWSLDAIALTTILVSLDGYHSQELDVQAEDHILNVQLVSLCSGVECPPGYKCISGGCFQIDPCSDVECPSGYECLDGECYPIDPCSLVTCPDGMECHQGGCFFNYVSVSGSVVHSGLGMPLSGVAVKLEQTGVTLGTTDAQGYFDVEITAGNRLVFEMSGYEPFVSEVVLEGQTGWLIELVDILCVDLTCPPGTVCYGGACIPIDPCSDVECPSGYECLDGECYPIDPCSLVTCPDGTECYQGQCIPVAFEVTGIVRDLETNELLSGVSVESTSQYFYTGDILTDENGYYSIFVEYNGVVNFTKAGYEIFSSSPVVETPTVLDVFLQPLENPCENVTCPPGEVCVGGQCFPVLCEASFTSLQITPEIGTSETEFTFTISYADPAESSLDIGFPMLQLIAENSSAENPIPDLFVTMSEVDPTDEILADGKLYQAVVSGLSDNTSWKASVRAVNENGCETLSAEVNAPQVSVSNLDVAIYANNISFSNETPSINEAITIFARIRNISDFPAENFVVSAYDNDLQIYSTTIQFLSPRSHIDVSWEYSFVDAGFYPIKVVIDETDVLEEINELNNFAIRPVLAGNYVLPGGIDVTAMPNTQTVYVNSWITVSGNAYYYGIDDGVNPNVAGANATMNYENGSFETTSGSGGNFSRSIRMPAVPGVYTFNVSITDYTLTGHAEPFEVTVIPYPDKPDLVASILLGQSSVLTGETITGVATVSNSGDATASNFIFRISSCEGILDEILIASLAPGESLQFSFETSVSATGSCFNKNNCTFYATADVGNAVDEKTKTNNTSSRSMTVYPPLPDLTPSRSLVSSSSAMEQPFLFTVKVDNIGGVPAGTPFTVNVYVDDVLTDSRDFSDLGSCAQVSYEVEVLFATQEDHVIRIKVDEPLGSGAVHEYSENNNEFVRTVKYLSPNLRPNLNVRIQDLSVNPVLPLPNESFEINATVRNNGSASISGPVDVRFTVSTDGVETIYDTTLPDGLAFGSSAQLTVSTVLPSYGGHSVLVELDPGNLIAESSEYDNKAEMPLCVDFAPSQSGSVWGGGFFVNTSQNLTGRVRNLGLFTATNVGVTFLLDDVEIGSAVIPELGPTYAGLGHYVSIPYTFRDVGTFELTMVVDRSDDYIECNESNNETSRMITVRGPQPDLRILSEYISPTELNPDLNEEINLFVSFENIGAAPAQAFKVRVTVDDQQLGDDIQVSGLGAGQLTTVPVGVPYSSQTAGIKVIRGFVDVLQEADDVNYNNNEASRAIVVGQAPNLLFAGISLSASCPQTGDVVEISVDVENEGDMAADAEVHFYYISETDTIPIDFVPIYVDLQSTVSTSINWTVVNPDYSIYAEIKKSVPVEFNNLDNSIRAEFEDTTPPTVIVKNITVYLDENGVVEMAPEDVDDGSFDECGIAEMILDFHTFDCVAAGHYALVTLTVTDFSGNSASAEVEVLVLDTLPPVISGIPEDIAVDNDEGLCSAVVTWEEPSAGDNCEVESFTSDWNSGDAFPVGTTTVTYTATDIHGNVQTASFDVVVTDSELPVITGIPENIVVSMDLESDGAVVTWDEPAATDNCGGYSLEQSAGLASGSIFPVGITVVEYTATDASGNTTTASFTVTVIDTRAPQIVGLPELIEVNNDPDACGAIVAWTEPTTSHIYEVISLEQTDGPESGSFFPVGVTSVTYKAEDIHGNIATVSFTVTVIDNQPPVVITRDIQRVINEGESVVIQPSDLDSGSYDHCGIASMSLSRTTFTDADEGENLVILTVTDISGNIASGNAKVTITVNRETCTIQARAKDMTVYLSKDGVASINARQADDGSSTTCKGKLDLLLSQSLFTCLDLGIREVFLIARDRNGNEATASFMVMVLDNLAPAIAKTPNKLSITLAENEVFVLPDYRGVYPANDNCSVEGYIQFPEPGTVYTQPTVIQLTLTASDGSGNQTSAGIEITLARAGQTKGPVPKSAEISFESNSVEQDVRMWPNPSTGLVYISVPMEEGTDVRIEVHNVDGRKVHTANFTAGHPLLLDMTGQVAGLYMVRIFSGDQVFVRKLIRTDTH